MQQHDIDTLRDLPIAAQGNWVDNRTQAAVAGQTIDCISPIDGKTLTTLASSDEADVDLAVTSARRVFDDGSWSRMAPVARKTIMCRWADLIEQHALAIAVLGARDNGTEIRMALKGEPLKAAEAIRFYAEAIDKQQGEITTTPADSLCLVQREPVGVVAAIVPWNFPLMIASWKFGPALAAGNSVVLKPSEDASLSLLRVAQLAAEAGLPAGVLNVLTGLGDRVGRALAMHMDVDMLAFTGSGAVGRKLQAYSAQSNLKPVYLELGGKSPNIVFANAPDLARAARETVASIFRNSGQVCVAASRLLVEQSIADEFLTQVQEQATALRIGNPLDLDNTTGCISNQRQLNGVEKAVRHAVEQGGEILMGGHRLHPDSGGFYHEPTIIGQVTADMDIVQQEVFGPVLAVRHFDTEAQAFEMANETVYGLSAVVWSADLGQVHRAIAAIRAGIVQVNAYSGTDITAPLAGVRQSGHGADRSLHAFDKFQNLKTAWINLV